MRQSFKVLIWAFCALVAAAAFTFGYVLLFGLPAEVHNTKVVSPNGAYTATLHEVNTGAAGSYSQALLRRTADDKEVVLVHLHDRIEGLQIWHFTQQFWFC